MTPELNRAYREDERTYFRNLLEKDRKNMYWKKRIIEIEENNIPDHIDRSPRPDTRPKLKLTFASAVGLAGNMINQLRP